MTKVYWTVKIDVCFQSSVAGGRRHVYLGCRINGCKGAFNEALMNVPSVEGY